MDKFNTWFVAAFVSGLTALMGVLFIGEISRAFGAFHIRALFWGIIFIFVLSLFSLFSLVKANANKIKTELIISAVFSVFPIFAFLLNGFIFIVYFGNK